MLYQQNSGEHKERNQFKFSSMICCAAPSSGGVSIDLGSRPIVGLSREPSFNILPADDTL